MRGFHLIIELRTAENKMTLTAIKDHRVYDRMLVMLLRKQCCVYACYFKPLQNTA